MPKLLSIKPSTNKNKKFDALFDINGIKKSVSFGSAPNKDYTIYSKEDKALAEQKKKAYIARHKVNEDFNNPLTAGSLAKNILWNKPTIKESIADFKKKFNL
jgi:hypothetical protein